MAWDGVNRRKTVPLHRTLVHYRVLPLSMMLFSGILEIWLLYFTVDMVWDNWREIDAAKIAAIAALSTGLQAFPTFVFKFSYDFALDGKIDKDYQ